MIPLPAIHQVVQRIQHKVQITRFLSVQKQIKQTANEDLSSRKSEVVVLWLGMRLLMWATTGEVVNPCGVFVWVTVFCISRIFPVAALGSVEFWEVYHQRIIRDFTWNWSRLKCVGPRCGQVKG